MARERERKQEKKRKMRIYFRGAFLYVIISFIKYTESSMPEEIEAPGPLIVRCIADADLLMDKVRTAAASVRNWIAGQTGDPLDMLRRMKFEPVGFHPIGGHALNIVEQINQTWTFCVALAATRQLLLLHPDLEGFHLAPGAHACQALDIMSVAEGCVGAETFAAVTPRNNGKLGADILKLSTRHEKHRYVFFMSPQYPGNKRLPAFEQHGIEVWSVDV
jgi:hypothetical protein